MALVVRRVAKDAKDAKKVLRRVAKDAKDAKGTIIRIYPKDAKKSAKVVPGNVQK